MKKLLLSIICILAVWALSAQVSENFSDYNVGGKIAQQAQAMGRNYWTTWSSAPGGAEDGVVANQGGNAGHFTYNNDQVLLLGGKTTGVWTLSCKVFVPTGKDAYFNILSHFAGGASEWALEVYFNNGGVSPGIGSLNAGGQNTASFNYSQNAWNEVEAIVDLDNDHADFYIDGVLVYGWKYSLGAEGSGSPRVIDAMDIYPPTSTAISDFYIDDIVFAAVASGSTLFETSFDDKPNGSKVAQSYPEWFTTWSNAPGGAEDALISNEQSASAPQSAKLTWGNDLVFKAGNKTTKSYQYDFDMYIPNNLPAFFNVLHVFNGGSSEWALGVYFNITDGSSMPLGTNVHQNGVTTAFTCPSNAWFPVSLFVDLDNDIANIKINGTQILEWAFSLTENGGTGIRQLGAIDFYPPQSNSIFFIDNVVYSEMGGASFPVLTVSPDDKIDVRIEDGSSSTTTVTIANSGTSIGDFVAHAVLNLDGVPVTIPSTKLAYCSDTYMNAIGYNSGACTVEMAAKFPLDTYCDKAGTYLTKVSYFVGTSGVPANNTFIVRIYGQGTYNVPGEILSEKTFSGMLISNYWNDVVLSEPVLLDGQDIWIAIEVEQPSGGYCMPYDDAPSGPGGKTLENSDWCRRNGGTWSQLHIANPSLNSNEFMIKGFVEGNKVPGCWLSFSGNTYGSIPAGQSANFNLKLDAAGLPLEAKYTATLRITTNDPQHSVFNIPITLDTHHVGITQLNNNKPLVYPNPASTCVNIETTGVIKNITIYNTIGQVVYSNSNKTNVNVASFKKGVYFVVINTNEGTTTTKLLVE